MKLDLSELAGLSETDLHQIDDWLDEYSYRQTARLASEKFNRPVNKNTIQRLANRAAPKDFLEDSPEAQETAGQILQFAASGQPQFTEAAVHVLEQTAFNLTFSCTHRVEDMKALQQISTMLFRHRNASVRERLAKVQEEKLQLRREELQGHGILPRKLPPDPPMDPAWIARKTAEFQQRFRNRFTNKVADEVTSPTSPSTHTADRNVESTASSDTVPSREDAQEPSGFNSNSRGLSLRNPQSEDATDSTPAGVLQSAPNESASSVVQSIFGNPAAITPLSLLKGPLSAQQTSFDGHPTCGGLGKSLGQGEGSPQSEIANQKSKIEIAADYTRRRSEEYNQWKSDHRRAKLGCPNAYFTQIPGCPCGKPLQCPDHPWPSEFLSMNPDHPEYEQALVKNGLSTSATVAPK